MSYSHLFTAIAIINPPIEPSTIHLVDVADFHALLEAVSDGPLAAGGSLGESNRATEGTSRSAVADTSNTDVVDTRNGSIARHAGRHLDLHGELGRGRKRDTLDTETGDILRDLGGLERSLAGAARGTVHIGGEGSSSILVDLWRTVSHTRGTARMGWRESVSYLSERHVHGAISIGSGHAAGGTLASSSSDTGLWGTLGLLAASTKKAGNTSSTTAAAGLASATGTATKAAEEAAEELPLLLRGSGGAGEVVFLTSGAGCTLVGGGSGSSAARSHEGSDHDGGIDVAVTLCPAERTGLAGGDLTVTDDGCVGLGTAAAKGCK